MAWTAQLYGYLPDYVARADFEAQLDAYTASYGNTNGKIWGVFWELYRLNSDGTHNFIDEAEAGVSAMGWSADRETYIKGKAEEVFITFASRFDLGAGLYADALLSTPALQTALIAEFVSFLTTNDFDGVSVNIEPITSITGTKKTEFLTFMTDLATALHANGKKLAWAGHMRWDPAVVGEPYSGTDYRGEGAGFLDFSLAELETTGVDILEAQCYDQFYDFGSQSHGIVSTQQIVDNIDFFKTRVTNDKISVILPGYGVKLANTDSYGPTIGGGAGNNMTRTQILAEDAMAYTMGTRDPDSDILSYVVDASANELHFADETSINTQRTAAEAAGVEYIGMWLLGDYPMPSGQGEPAPPAVPAPTPNSISTGSSVGIPSFVRN